MKYTIVLLLFSLLVSLSSYTALGQTSQLPRDSVNTLISIHPKSGHFFHENEDCWRIYGSIKEEKHNKPIKEVQVILEDSHFSNIDTAISNKSGEFIFKHLKSEETYRIIMYKKGYQHTTYIDIHATCQDRDGINVILKKGNFSINEKGQW